MYEDYYFLVSRTNTVSKFTTAVAQKLGLASNKSIRLVYNGEELANNRLLSYYDFEEGDVVYIHRKPTSGKGLVS